MEQDKRWQGGYTIAHFECNTNGPERYWAADMRVCKDDGKEYVVINEPFSERLMWFNADETGMVEARHAYSSIVGLALCDTNPDSVKIGRIGSSRSR